MTNQDVPIYIVCNADNKTGLGHLLRCLSLAKELQMLDKYVQLVGYFSQTAIEFIDSQFLDYQHRNTAEIAKTLKSLPANAQIVLDSYDYQAVDLIATQKTILIDDFCRLSHYPVQGVINFTIHATQYNYKKKGAQAQALGLDYFLPHPTLKTTCSAFNPLPNKLLILIGSGDPTNLVPKMLNALNNLPYHFEIRVLTNKAIQANTKHQLEIYPLQRDINPFYQWADMLITSGGLAKYEAAFVHKPAVVFSQTLGEQAETLDFAKAGLCYDFGLAEVFDGMIFAENFITLLTDIERRVLAFQESQKLFKEDSSARAAEFVQHCLTRPGC